MIGVGLAITRPMLSKALARPGTLAVVVIAQAVLLPVAGAVVVLILDPPMEIAAAILLISACPGGGLSNILVLIAKANVSLSVMLTLAGLAIAGLTLPAALAAFRYFGFDTGMGSTSSWFLSVRMMLLIAMPVLLGMTIRKLKPGLADRLGEPLRKFAYILLFTILGSALVVRWEAIWSQLWETVYAVSMLLALTLATGFVVGKAFFADRDDRFAVTTEFAVRNLALGSAVGLGFQGNLGFVGPGVLYLVVEGTVLLTAAFARRTNKRPESTANG